MSDPAAPRSPFLPVTGVFVVLAIALEGMLAGYWTGVLQPRLHAEAVSQARILAQSQARVLVEALRRADPASRASHVADAMDQILLFKDQETAIPFFDSVALEIDYSVLPAPEGTLDLRRGNAAASSFPSEVALYDTETQELLGIARLSVSDRFYRLLSRDVRSNLLLQGGTILVILSGMWGLVTFVLRKLRIQTLERTRAERALYGQLQKYQRLLDSLSNYFVYSRGKDGRLGFVSDAVSRVLGFTPDELARSAGAHLTDHPINARVASGAAELPGRQVVYEIEIRDKQGGIHRIEQTEVPVLDEAGEVTGVEGIARDVTEQRTFELELHKAKDQAEEANRAKSAFLANMSHEIRTPMNAILGMTQLALKTGLSGKQKSYLSRINASGRLLLDIINDILDLSKIEAGRMDLVAQDFDLDEVLTGLAGVVGIRAGEKGLEFLFATAPGVPRRLRGDSLRLQQVLLNLTNNAIKFTEEGEIVVRVDRVGENADHVELRFMVKDTGIGISAQDASKLFEPFSQIDASSTRRYGGTGLGLVISRRLVELMGGSLTFESTPGQGSTFTFNARFGSAATDRDSHGTQEGLRGMPVLVADDNLTARKVLREMLTSLSFDVTTVASGEEALSSVEARRSSERPFGLVILDWKMPGMDGIEAARRLRAQPARIPVMLITAYGGEDVMRRAEAVADAFVTKPVSQSHLFNKVLEAVGATHRAPRSRAAAPAAAASSVNEARVLLVEDNEINREVAVELLGGSGVAVTIATNGREALELLERVPRFDAILMDVQMPEMDGMEATRRIRSRPGLAQIPIIAMTAHAMLGDRERFLEAGMSDYISKPIEEDKLLAVLSRWVKADPSAPAARPRRASELPDIPGLDVADGVRRTAGNQALYRRLLGAFSRDNATTAERLRSAIASDAREEALMIVHGLKGTASTISATKVAAAAAALEKALHARTGSDPLMAELEVELGSVLSSILAMEPEDAGAPVAAPAAEPPDAGLLRELEELLATQNTRALRCYESLKPRLAAIMPRAKMETLERSLQGLDFEAALGHIREMAAHLPEPIV